MSTPEELQTLPVGHPEAGYYGPEPGQSYKAGTPPPELQTALDTLVSDWEAEVAAVQQHEHEVATTPPEGSTDPQATAKKAPAKDAKDS